MITKDQLDLLEKPLPKNEELHFTIGGSVETVVHSSLESERIGKRNRGHRVMNEVAVQLENNIAFKFREGLAKGQFQHSATELPPKDRSLAERTWQANHIAAHRDSLNRASNKLRSAIHEAARNQPPTIDSDLGYGASVSRSYVDAYVKQHGSQAQPTRDDRVGGFRQQMKTKNQGQERER